MNSTKYLFLGGLFPKETEAEIIKKSKGVIQNAANAFQWNIIKGLDENLTEPITILNSLYIGSYPKRYNDCFIKSYEFHHTKEAKDLNVGFCNLMGYKHLSRRITLKNALRRWIKDNQSANKVIFAYAMTGVMMDALSYAKKLDPTIKTCLIVPDLPQYMNTGAKKSFIFSLLKNIDLSRMNKQKKAVDLWILLTEQMHVKLNINNFVVVEGIANNYYDVSPNTSSTLKNILYTGTLKEQYGVVDLVEAFVLTKSADYRLIICGAGGAEEKIKEMAKLDSRIIFKGQLPHSEILNLQKKATVLVNPRKGTEEFTKYSFPSKNLEYLSSGVPLVAYKLDGIPDEYDAYINYVPDNTIDSFSKVLTDICELPIEKRMELGNAAKVFVLNNKNAKIQTKKILDAINCEKTHV